MLSYHIIMLSILMMYFISSFDIIGVVLQNPNIFLCIPASAANAAAFNPKEIETIFANCF